MLAAGHGTAVAAVLIPLVAALLPRLGPAKLPEMDDGLSQLFVKLGDHVAHGSGASRCTERLAVLKKPAVLSAILDCARAR